MDAAALIGSAAGIAGVVGIATSFTGNHYSRRQTEAFEHDTIREDALALAEIRGEQRDELLTKIAQLEEKVERMETVVATLGRKIEDARRVVADMRREFVALLRLILNDLEGIPPDVGGARQKIHDFLQEDHG